MRSIIVALICLSLFSSCEKELTYNNMLNGELSVEFDNIAGGADLQLSTASYTNALSETFKVTKLKYFVSNFVFTNVNGSIYSVPKDSCYFLIDESDEDSHEPVLNVPEGEYKTLSFLLGVDSLKNAADISERTGSLDPAAAASDMYWGWNQGYIFFKMDGTSPLITSMGNTFMYHVGGFGGYNSVTPNNLKVITLDLTTRGTPKVKAGKETNIHLFVDILKALNGTTNMSFATTAMIHSISGGIPVANNYASMFSHDHTEN